MSMISIVSMKDVRVFLAHAAHLYDIWPTWLADTMLDATVESFIKPNTDVDIAPPYLILYGSTIIGMTGLFAGSENPKELYLRWTGISRFHRGRGHFRDVITELCMLAQKLRPSCEQIVEVMPTGEYSEIASVIFESVGFKATDTVRADWSPVKTWREYRLDMDEYMSRAIANSTTSLYWINRSEYAAKHKERNQS